ncbi:MAG: CoA transferase [Acidimicrobiales bacterium]
MSVTGILEGVRVIELADGIAGPTATMLLSSAGADVIKVEPPGGAIDRATPGSATWNRSKRSVVLDLDTASDRRHLDDLLAHADVLVHSMVPSEAAKRGLDRKSLDDRFPTLVHCAITAYPIGHPDDGLPPSDTLVLARAGLMDEQLPVRRRGPTYLRMPLGSWGAVYLATAGVLARLLARSSTGRGGAANTSLLQGALVPMTMHWARATHPTPSFATGMPKDPADYTAITPTLFECRDGRWIHVMGANVDSSPLMQKALAELGVDAVTAANAGGPSGNPNFGNFGANQAAFKMYDRDAWLDDLWANDVAVQACVPMGQIFDDEQANANGYVVEVDDPEWGPVRQAGIPFATTPPSTIIAPQPRPGAHTDEVVVATPPPRLPAASGARSLRWPLEGLRVLDFGAYLAGPIAPMLMADLGADVIKVESPTGDFMRFVERTFAGCQRGKRGIAIDLKNPAARAVLERLVATADVVHHNLRMPAARKLGIDYDSLRAINPDIVYCHVSSYGPAGPRADWPGFDQLFQASSGWEQEGAGEGNPPMWHRFGMMDHQGGMASLVATLLGLYWRERTGAGQFVAASLLGASVLTTSETMKLADGSLAPYDRLDADQMGVSPTRRITPVADGWVAVDATAPDGARQLAFVAGVPDVADAPEALRLWKVADLLAALARAGVPSTDVRLDQMNPFFDDPQTWEAGLACRYPHASLVTVEQIGSLWSFGELTTRLDRSSPEVGQHSLEVLAELGFSDADMRSLLVSGAVATERTG